MKSLKLMLTATLVASGSFLFAQSNQKSDTVKVYGECGMCKSRIEKVLKVEGISSAIWDEETKLLIVSYDPSKISNEDIQKKVAAVGHDTEKFKAPDEVYKKLPGCCKYDRKKQDKAEDHSGHQHRF